MHSRHEATRPQMRPRGATLVNQVACVQRIGSPFNQGGPGRKLPGTAGSCVQRSSGRRGGPRPSRPHTLGAGALAAGFLRNLDLETSGHSKGVRSSFLFFLLCPQFALLLGPGAGAAAPAQPGEPPPASALGTSARPGYLSLQGEDLPLDSHGSPFWSCQSIHCFLNV